MESSESRAEGVCAAGDVLRCYSGATYDEPRISLLLVARVPRGTAAGVARKGQAENRSPIQAASPVPADRTGGGRKRESPALALSAINCGSRCIHFCGAQKSLAFAWWQCLGLYLF